MDLKSQAKDILLIDNYAYVADGENGLIIIDVHDPTNPKEVGHYDTLGDTRSVFVKDGYAYLPDYDNGLVILDVSDPTKPILVKDMTWYTFFGVDGN